MTPTQRLAAIEARDTEQAKKAQGLPHNTAVLTAALLSLKYDTLVWYPKFNACNPMEN